MRIDLSGQTAIVTGGSSGIGRAIAELFAAEGADVIIPDIRSEPRGGGRPTADLINGRDGGEATFIECDITDPDAIDAVVSIGEDDGGIDILVNNAGVIDVGDYLEDDPEGYDRIMDVNARATYFLTQSVARSMVAADCQGSIINISSLSGIIGLGSFVSYCMSKGAIRLFTYSLAHRLGPEGIRVNAIHPGSIDTEIVDDGDEETASLAEETIPSRRFGEPIDVARVALFLASDLAGYVNGESLLVDGGYGNTGSPRFEAKRLIGG